MASGNLKTLSEIFNNKIFRIPDYQRGYAWENRHREDFWRDLENLSDTKKHYIGMLTISEVKGDNEYVHVIDGQQRLTTIVILIKNIVKKFNSTKKMGKEFITQGNKVDKVIETYIKLDLDENETLTIFGYDKQNGSYDFYENNIIGDIANDSPIEKEDSEGIQTVYIKNLKDADDFFEKALKNIELEDLGVLFKKVSTQLIFNLYEIDESDGFDEYVIFETMNNRGKPLTTLELLKNRLMYLVSLSDNENDDARNNINEAWKNIYEYLGRFMQNNKKLDEKFLKNHWSMYWGKKDDAKDSEKEFLLDEFFITKKILVETKDKKKYNNMLNLFNDFKKQTKVCINQYRDNYKLKGKTQEKENKKLFDNYKKLDTINNEIEPLISKEYRHSLMGRWGDDVEMLMNETENDQSYKVSDSRTYVDNTLSKKIGKLNSLTNIEIYASYININTIKDYSDSLCKGVESYYYALNPNSSSLDSKVKLLLQDINKLGIESFVPVVMSLLNQYSEDNKRLTIKCLEIIEIERFIQIYVRSSSASTKKLVGSYESACGFNHHKDIKLFYVEIKEYFISSKGYMRSFRYKSFLKDMMDNFDFDNDTNKDDKKGFYKWKGIEYILLEYELNLRSNSESKGKISHSGKYSVEHIIPQHPKKDGKWSKYLKETGNKNYQDKVINSIGNLMIIPSSQNSALSNKEFEEKKEIYKTGNYSEVEVSQNKQWTKTEIKTRGIKILKFMSKKWLLEMSNKDITQLSTIYDIEIK